MFSQRTGWNLAPNRFSVALNAYRTSGRPLLDLTASNPTRVGLHYEQQKIAEALSHPAILDYSPEPKGLRIARDAVCRYYGEKGEQVSPDRVILTTSTSEGYGFVFRLLCDPGDEVLIPSPSYPLFDFLADLQDVRLAPYSLFYDYGWHIDFHSLRERLSERTRAVIVVHPNNPTGSFVKAEETAQLNALCAERGLAMVVDEVFLDFSREAEGGNGSFVRNDRALTFTLSGLSKIAGLPQVKFAWIVASGPEQLVRESLSRLEVIADTYLSMNAPVQFAAPALLETRQDFQRQLKTRIAANLNQLDCQLRTQQLVSRLEIEGGWYAILRVPVTGSDEDLAIALLEHEGVLVHPGHFYDFRSDGYLVVSLISPEAEFREGIAQLLKMIG